MAVALYPGPDVRVLSLQNTLSAKYSEYPVFFMFVSYQFSNCVFIFVLVSLYTALLELVAIAVIVKQISVIFSFFLILSFSLFSLAF